MDAIARWAADVEPAVRERAATAFQARACFDLADEALWRRWQTLETIGVASVFQTCAFVRPLLTELAPALGHQPFVVEVFDAAGGHVLSMGLVRDHGGGIRRVEFADFGLCDLTGPIWRRDLDSSPEALEALRRSILAALPPHDVLLLTKMPKVVEGVANPLVAWPGVSAMHVATMVFEPGEIAPADLPAVKESARKRRRLARDGGVLQRVESAERAADLLEFAFDLRDERARREGRHELLSHPAVRDFYRRVVGDGLATGAVEMWEARLADRPIAMIQGFVHRRRFNGTLMATATDDGLNVYSPGMIAIAAALEHHVANRGGAFDLGAGEHTYKARFGGEPQFLHEYDRAATLLGQVSVINHRLRRTIRSYLRRHPVLRARLYRLLGKG